ncbi:MULTISPECIES: 3'(2'),5'-bisphosphate nucleotidase CysQ [Brucella]|uniref:3'(2'),5'-bisphosphate nucleotidase CysQ n=18 Tax=Brucella TaxID=234 RepID=A0AAI8E6W5_BRUSS|nr:MULTISPECIES: 3'(2'),5'-bisphosphate nucleotidase CysQ [Brucella]EPZ76201.1 3'-5'-bisphosphate nucleotidase [Brucella melitensis ADMAS-G1]ERM86862.1 3'-5'-bisphosphate nucleotidase [Brucella abortus 82]ERT85840.1 3'(2'),5'-bisphosphate nucleotidase [Brucella abortus 90-12178]ERT99042.1 3'(2'),5'-bisphosphate nucleotidase [Brucella abortus 99-9971-135]ERU11359.1 3'(2'),5'-bisphosphate nucleotidase [Brucella abortus 07-0994-2411]EXU84825.1 3'-5'-bisphosphate nucleotidase [Brucella melitensis
MKISASPKAGLDGTALRAVLRDAALEAGRSIMKHYVNGCAVQSKKDASPVTEADHAAEAIILAALSSACPDVPVVAEEEVAAGRLPDHLGRKFLLVDPLDGTREFLLRNGDFTVNIGLVEEGAPVLGIVYAPARNLLFIGSDAGAWAMETTPDHGAGQDQRIFARVSPAEKVAVCSRSHLTPETERFLAENRIASSVSVGSSLKFCILAKGEADIYPRFGPTMEWDTAAGDAVLRAAGGMTATLDGRPMIYGQRLRAGAAGFANPDFVAYGAGEAPVFTTA